ncbi:ABC transporter permease [Albirhodobacter sp. R86504]|uniref:ABC transporter permease n=1 Tax=Albirhodobacter sp. R86504 TaxID=3093848 RepID=UPI00367320C2
MIPVEGRQKLGAHARQGAVLGLILGVLILPVLAGLWDTLRSAFGVSPILGRSTPSLAPWLELFDLAGVARSLRLSLVTGVGSTLISLCIAIGTCAALGGRMPPLLTRGLAPFLAVPHAAMAVGLAFLLSPSGWIARLLAPAFDWAVPPQIATVNDPLGIALMMGLVVKETPFLIFVILSAQAQIPTRQYLAVGASLGYARGAAWIKLVAPSVWPLIRLPVLAVLSYALSNVDMALILGPSSPPSFAVAVMRWFTAPDLLMTLPASAGAILQAALVAGVWGALIGAERVIARLGRIWLRRGARGAMLSGAVRGAALFCAALFVAGTLAILSLAIWSITWRWSFPLILPESISLRPWAQSSGWPSALKTTLTLAIGAVGMSLAMAILWLEAEDRGKLRLPVWILYLPLIVPQIGFLYGLQSSFLRASLPHGMIAVIWAHSLFVFPYIMLALRDPWRNLDARHRSAAASLGAGPMRRLLRVKLPMLLAPILAACAIGVAVSVAQYLPTLFMGAGRIVTLTTEAVTLSSGSDRRITGVFAALQASLPLLAYLAAFAIPRWRARHFSRI